MTRAAVEELGRTGRLYVPYDPSLRAGVEKAMQAWEAFCALPNERKVLFDYGGDTNVSGNGYELKIDPGSVDQKEDAHLRVNVREQLLLDAAKADPILGPAFVTTALDVNELMAPMMRDFARAIEGAYGISGFEEDVMSWQPRWLIRFLHYFGDRHPGEEIAAPHVDKGGFTLHLYESHPGVEYLTYDTREWKELPLSHDETVVIPGLGLQNRSKGQLRALAHRVVATEDTAQTGRFSAVCFFNFANVRFWNKVANGSTQKWPPGFFYDMSHADFDQYFID